MMEKIILITGGFDPIHSGHLAYINSAKALGDILIVGLNSDEWLIRKKGKEFLSFSERFEVLNNLKNVDLVINFNDSDNSAKDAIQKVRSLYPQNKIIFANGGDRTKTNIPEMDSNDTNIDFVFGVGGENKKNSSSWILEEWKHPKTTRPWGYYRILHEVGSTVKVKELVVDSGKKLSMQRHSQRAEHWFVAEGTATVYTINQKTEIELLGTFEKHQHIHIDLQGWHQLSNEQSRPLKIIEIQYGQKCIEEDIERK